MLTKTTPAGRTTYEWNYDNRLMSVTDPNNQVTSYGYDPWGIRVRMSDANGTKRFLYSREDLIAEYDATNTLTAYYAHGPLIDEPLAQQISGTLSYMHRDGLGSVTAFSSPSGQLAGTSAYEAFGKLHETTGITSRYGYTSRELDWNGLMYYRSRYYQPEIGRFLNQDFYKGNDLIPPSLHRYIYTHNNPVNYGDPGGNMLRGFYLTMLFFGLYYGFIKGAEFIEMSIRHELNLPPPLNNPQRFIEHYMGSKALSVITGVKTCMLVGILVEIMEYFIKGEWSDATDDLAADALGCLLVETGRDYLNNNINYYIQYYYYYSIGFIIGLILNRVDLKLFHHKLYNSVKKYAL